MVFWAEHSAFVDDDEKDGVKWLFLLSHWLYLSLTCAVSLIKPNIRKKFKKKASQHWEANIIISLILCLLSRLLCLLLSEDNCRHVPFELLLAASTLFFSPPFPFLDFYLLLSQNHNEWADWPQCLAQGQFIINMAVNWPAWQLMAVIGAVMSLDGVHMRWTNMATDTTDIFNGF